MYTKKYGPKNCTRVLHTESEIYIDTIRAAAEFRPIQ